MDKGPKILLEGYESLADSTIMIVDDEPITMDVVQAYLEEHGFRKFVLLERASEAIRVMEETRPDIMLLDLMMPELSGFEILAAVRKHARFRHLPVIILTASTDANSRLKTLELGATDFLTKPVDQSELILRVRNTLAAKAYLDQLAYYDSLTKLPNRQMFQEFLTHELARAKRLNDGLAILMIEMDNFSRISDTMGIDAGDEILREVSRRIQHAARQTDIVSRCDKGEESAINLFRMEGCVFSLLLTRITDIQSAAIVADRILDQIRKPLLIDGREVFGTASIGIAAFPDESQHGSDLLLEASRAKEYVIHRGGDSFQFSSLRINQLHERRLYLERRLRSGLEKEAFVLHYQPKIDVATGTIRGAEALLRLHDGNGGLISPLDFIPLAEETGLIVPIGEWVIHEACQQIMRWQKECAFSIGLSVNISARQLHSRDALSTIRQIIKGSGIDGQLLTLELTESMLLQEMERNISSLQSIKDMGIRLSIDDFGIGYSSFNYLRKIPADELKLDQSFISDLSEGDKSCAIVSSIIYLAKKLGVRTVAEGVETGEQLDFLQTTACDMYQGYFFSKPVPIKEFLSLFDAGR